MTPLKFIAGFFLLAFTACKQSDSRPENKNLPTQNNHPSYIVFGLFCGQCVGHCATMYRYNMMGNSNTLLVDTTDSYFKNAGQIIWKTPIIDKAKLQIVNKLVQQIPEKLLISKDSTQTFGCPDCADGCGFYFELGQGTTVKKCYIDTNTTDFDPQMKEFTGLLNKTLEELQ